MIGPTSLHRGSPCPGSAGRRMSLARCLRCCGGDRAPAGTPVIAGTIDAWAEAVSVGVRRRAS